MRVGAVEETVTVSGQSPIVDVQSAVTQNAMNRELLDTVPTGRSYHMAAVTTPGVNVSRVDVGGSEGFFYTRLMAHGSLSQDQAIQLDGMSTVDGEGSGEVQGIYRDDADNEEIVFQTSALPAEVSQGGVRINMIGKEGSNQFKGAGVLAYAPGELQSNNVTPELQAKGLRTPDATKKIYDYNISGGGPIMRERLWFFASARYWGKDLYRSNTFYGPNHPTKAGQVAIDDGLHTNWGTRLTYQMNEKNKLAAYYGRQPTRTLYHRGVGRGRTPEASSIQSTALLYSATAKWTSTLSSNWLVEAGFATTYLHWRQRPQGHWTGREWEPQTCCAPTQIEKQDLTLGTFTGDVRPNVRRLAVSTQLRGVSLVRDGRAQPEARCAVR